MGARPDAHLPAMSDDAVFATVKSLHLYPVKACGAMDVASLEFTPSGRLRHDREWAVVNELGQVTWQGAFAALSQVRPHWHDGRLMLRGPKEAVWLQPAAAEMAPCTVLAWNELHANHDPLPAADAGSGAAHFLQQVTGAALRLVRLDPSVDMVQPKQTVHFFADASVAEVSHLWAGDGTQGQALSFARFRPNIVLGPVDDTPLLPFLEEVVERLEWGDDESPGELVVTGPCDRCIVTTVCPQTGASDPSVLAALVSASAERHPGRPVRFGMYARLVHGAVLRRGDTVRLQLAF